MRQAPPARSRPRSCRAGDVHDRRRLDGRSSPWSAPASWPARSTHLAHDGEIPVLVKRGVNVRDDLRVPELKMRRKKPPLAGLLVTGDDRAAKIGQDTSVRRVIGTSEKQNHIDVWQNLAERLKGGDPETP